MLSLSTIKEAAVALSYFDVGKYYLQGTTVPNSLWYGNLARDIDLADKAVAPQLFQQFLQGVAPNGKQLSSGRENNEHRPGYDLTFSAPKSVSLLIEIANAKCAQNAHMAAVKKTLDYIEQSAITYRKWVKDENSDKATVKTFKSSKMLTAIINHSTSRENEPHTHAHCVLMNMTQDDEKMFRALTSDYIFKNKMLYGTVYRSYLAKELMRAGYEIEKTHDDGRFEVKGFTQEQLAAFSTRRQQIEQYLQEKNLWGAVASAKATTATRPPKREVNEEKLKTMWQQSCQELGLDVNAVVQKAQLRVKNNEIPKSGKEIDKSVEWAVNNLSERSAVFSGNLVMQYSLAHDLGHTTIEDFKSFSAKTLENISFSGLDKNDYDKALFTTTAELTYEQRNIDIWKACIGQREVNERFQSYQFSPKSHLTQGQQKALKHILAAPDRIIGIQGYAGTGKTKMLSETTGILNQLPKLVQAITRQKIDILGCAVTGSAANQLKTKAQIPAYTVAQFLLQAQSMPFRNQTIVVLDEASMISSKDMNQLLEIVDEKKNMTLVMIGDQAQIASVNAGKPFQQLISKGMKYVVMDEIMRQQCPRLKSAVEKIIHEDLREAVELLKKDVHQITDTQERLVKVSEKYLKLSDKERDDCLVIVGTHVERNFINQYVRNRLVEEEKLGKKSIEAQVMSPIRIGNTRLNNILNYEVGMRLRFHETTDRFIRRGQYYTVSNVDQKNQVITLEKQGKKENYTIIQLKDLSKELFQVETKEFRVGDKLLLNRGLSGIKSLKNNMEVVITEVQDDRISVRIPGDKSNKTYHLNTQQEQHMHIDYAYSRTLFSSQGDDKSTVILSMDSKQGHAINYRGFYVGVSRAQKNIHIYSDDFKECINQICVNTGENLSALEMKENNPKEFVKAQAQLFPKEKPNPKQIQYSLFEKQKTPRNNQYTTTNLQNFAPSNQTVRFDFSEKFVDTKAIDPYLTPDVIKSIVCHSMGTEPNKTLSSTNRIKYGRKGSFSMSLEPNSYGLWKDFESDEGGNIYQLVQRNMGLSFPEAVKQVANMVGYNGQVLIRETAPAKKENKQIELDDADRKAIAKAQKLYKQCRPIKGTLAEKYLKQNRKIKALGAFESVKFHPNLYEPQTKKYLPALVVGATRQGKIEAIQAIYLDPKTTNKYPNLDVGKRTTGRLKFGASVKMGMTPNPKILVCEGPETALSVKGAFPNHTVICSLSISNMAKINYPKSHDIIICQDNDLPGSASTKTYHRIEKKLKNKGYRVYSVRPDDRYKNGERVKNDYNDELKRIDFAGVYSQIQKQIDEKIPAQRAPDLEKNEPNMQKIIPHKQEQSVESCR